MFHDIPPSVTRRMRALEAQDARDRVDGTHQKRRLRQVPPETGRFLALMAAAAPPGMVVEIGTSAGYSSLWIALARVPWPELVAMGDTTIAHSH